MGADERFELTEKQREWLDSLSPKERHAASDALHTQWQGLMMVAESMDHTVDLLLPHGRGEVATDFFTATALHAEAFRAMARGDQDKAAELFAAGGEYAIEPGSIEIVVEKPPTDE
jgi:hypothetical protein